MSDDELLVKVEKLIEETDDDNAKIVLHALAGSLAGEYIHELALSCRMFVLKKLQQLDPVLRKN